MTQDSRITWQGRAKNEGQARIVLLVALQLAQGGDHDGALALIDTQFNDGSWTLLRNGEASIDELVRIVKLCTNATGEAALKMHLQLGIWLARKDEPDFAASLDLLRQIESRLGDAGLHAEQVSAMRQFAMTVKLMMQAQVAVSEELQDEAKANLALAIIIAEREHLVSWEIQLGIPALRLYLDFLARDPKSGQFPSAVLQGIHAFERLRHDVQVWASTLKGDARWPAQFCAEPVGMPADMATSLLLIEQGMGLEWAGNFLVDAGLAAEQLADKLNRTGWDKAHALFAQGVGHALLGSNPVAMRYLTQARDLFAGSDGEYYKRRIQALLDKLSG